MHYASPDLEPKSAGQTAMGITLMRFDVSGVESCDEKKERSKRNEGFYTHHFSLHESTDHA